jgi:hypothetical protein
MLENNIGRLPVVDRNDQKKMVGYINRASVMGSWRGHLHEESVREHGWLRALASNSENGNSGSGIATGRIIGLSNNEIRLTPNSHADSSAEDFALSEPLRGVILGDEVRVSYRNEKGRKVAVRIEELSSRQ